MGAENQVILSRMDGNVINGNGREVALKFHPLLSSINREVGTSFCSDKKKIGIPVVLSYNIDNSALRQIE
ncbi:hypothetical protein ES705_39125 [subsurface metagenome]